MALTDLEEAVRAGAIGPETPVRAPVLTDDRWRPVGELALYQGLQSSPEALLRRALATPRLPWFTVILVGIQLRVFLWMHGTPPNEGLLERFAKYTPAILERYELWRLVSYGFLHGSVGHVAMNMMFVAYIGAALERVVGSLNLAVLFFGSVFWGGVLSAMLSPASPSIGASAGDFGYLAAAAVFGLRWLELLPRRERPSFGFAILLYLLYGLLNGVLSSEPVDNWAHLGGLLFGGLFMVALRPHVGEVWRARNRGTSLLATALIGVGLVGMARLPLPLVPVEQDGLVASRPVWWTVGWAPTGESAWASPVGGALLVARTTRGQDPRGAAEAVGALLADYREVDPSAALMEEAPTAIDGVEARRVRVGYTDEGVLREVEAIVATRGRYVHRVVVDTPIGEARAARMAERVLAGVRLPTPAAVERAREAGEGWRGRLERARGEADVGAVDEARRLVDAALTEAPGEPAAAQALLELLAAYPSAEVATRADELLARFPADRDVRGAAVRALLAAGDREGARRRLDDGLAAAPGDRKLARLREELFGEGG